MVDVPTRTRRVLIVDDDTSFGDLLKRDLTVSSCEVETAVTPAEAIARVAAAVPDMVVLDLYLPGGAALDLLRLWKTQLPALVVILVSDNASLSVVVDALTEGAHRFFTKPVAAATLLDELDKRHHEQHPSLPALVAARHRLGAAALNAEGIDRFFAISPGLLSVAGFDGYFKMLNPAWEKALGYSVAELCSKPYLDLVHPDDRAKATDEAIDIRGGETVFRFTNRYRCKDGSYRWLEWMATPSPAHHLIYASARDVTERVRMEQGLRDSYHRLMQMMANRDAMLQACSDNNTTLARTNDALSGKNDTLVELGRFKEEVAAMIVHDLKNPLSVIVANYDYILEEFEGSADCLDALRSSQTAGQRMLRLLANLVDVGRLEGGTLNVRPSEINLLELLESVAEQRRVLATSGNIEIVVAPSSEANVTADADLVTRTLENIFDNALRHTPRGGMIEIELRELGLNVEIRIGNSGGAIPVGARHTIFEKYCQATSNLGHVNLGLGLYFCRLAIEAQGGGIWVEETNRMPTVFCIRLPRVAANPGNTGGKARAGNGVERGIVRFD
jgi:PAS domain S-box-containing protein